jgi:hypothetical protein
MENIEELKVVDLKRKLKELGLATSGLKKDLVKRLQMVNNGEEVENERDDDLVDTEQEEEDEVVSEQSDEENDTEQDDEEVDTEEEEENEVSELIEVESSNKKKSPVKVMKKNGTRGQNYNFDFVSKYPNVEEALNVMVNEKVWTKGNKKETKDGVKQFYNCKFMKTSRCEAKCFSLYHNDDDGVSHHQTEQRHSNYIKDSKHGIIGKYIEAIDSIYEIFQKPKEIKRQLLSMYPKDNKEDLPTDQQLKNYLAYKRTKKGYKAKLNFSELEQWCLANDKIPESMDEMFVKRSFRLDKKTHKVIFFVFFTTKRLLSLAIKTKHICADTTFKLIQHGYPLLIVGTTDKAKVFHPFGIAMCANEKEEAYTFIFKPLYDCIYVVYNYAYQPNILICDAADALTNGFTAVFGKLLKRVLCWFHIVKAFEDHETYVSIPSPHKENIKQDICSLQLSESDVIFESAYILFKEKWLKVNSTKIPTKKFFEYFEGEWINKHPGLYEGYAPAVPSTKNG